MVLWAASRADDCAEARPHPHTAQLPLCSVRVTGACCWPWSSQCCAVVPRWAHLQQGCDSCSVAVVGSVHEGRPPSQRVCLLPVSPKLVQQVDQGHVAMLGHQHSQLRGYFSLEV